MPMRQDAESVGLMLSIGVASVSILLVLWLWYDRTTRFEDELSDEDATYFRRQDRRRGFVAFVLLLLSAGISIGSRLEHKVDGHANILFVQTWLGVFVLVFALLLLAMFDWLATRGYARRHIKSLIKEKAEILKEEARLRTKPPYERNGGDTHQDGASE